MSELAGTQVAAGVVPFDSLDQFATHYAEYGRGGWRSAASTTVRNAIPYARREIGMVVQVGSDSWRLLNLSSPGVALTDGDWIRLDQARIDAEAVLQENINAEAEAREATDAILLARPYQVRREVLTLDWPEDSTIWTDENGAVLGTSVDADAVESIAEGLAEVSAGVDARAIVIIREVLSIGYGEGATVQTDENGAAVALQDGVGMTMREVLTLAYPDGATVWTDALGREVTTTATVAPEPPEPVAVGFAAYGDSITAGADLADAAAERFSTLLGAMLGATVTNRGTPGDTSHVVNNRLGARTAVGLVTDSEIPGSGGVVIYDIAPPMTRQPTLTVDLILFDGTTVRGTLADNLGFDDQSTFTRLVAGDPITVDGLVDIVSVTGQSDWGGVILYGPGVNDGQPVLDGDDTIGNVKAEYARAKSVATTNPPRFVPWGILDRGLTEAPGTLKGDYIAEMEVFFHEKFGAQFAPVRQYLASQRALDDAQVIDPGFTPTSDDTDAVTAGCVPPGFRSGTSSVHPNALGHQLIARFLFRHLNLPANRWMLEPIPVEE